jgi:hypothetical protein
MVKTGRSQAPLQLKSCRSIRGMRERQESDSSAAIAGTDEWQLQGRLIQPAWSRCYRFESIP